MFLKQNVPYNLYILIKCEDKHRDSNDNSWETSK